MPPKGHKRVWSSSVDVSRGGLPAMLRSREEHEERHGLLDDALSSAPAEKTERPVPRTGVGALLRLQAKPLAGLVIAWVVLAIYLLQPKKLGAQEQRIQHVAQNSTNRNPPAALHLLVPASKGHPDLCKLMVSAGALGYPDPVIINWNRTLEAVDRVGGGVSQRPKISGINEYLRKVPGDQDEDIVVILNGLSTRLQLRPQTLVDRYFDLNSRADKRIAKELGEGAVQQKIKQKIIFGAQKHCEPWAQNDPPCYAAPLSALPEKVFGPDTDTDIGNKEFPYLKFRPRYLNSGFMVGTVGAARKLYAKADYLMDTNGGESYYDSDQNIFSRIFADQQLWRESVRLDARNEIQVMKEEASLSRAFNPKDIETVRTKAASQPDGTYEFGIGLDTESLIGLNTLFGRDNSTDFLIWKDEKALRAAENSAGVLPESQHSHMKILSEDITDTVPPFWTFNHEPQLPRWRQWTEIPLFTHIWTGIVPAIIHDSAPPPAAAAAAEKRSARFRQQWWEKVWYHKFSRLLYDAHIYEPTLPVAFSGATDPERREYWPAERWHGGGRNSTMYDEWNWWVRFEDICTNFHEEIFGDGKGPWVLPDVH